MSNENLSPNSSNPDLTKLNNGESGTIDTSKFSPNEMKLYKMYGKLPSKKDIFKHTMQKRKYFDSGDYALQKAGIQNNDPINYGKNNLPLTNPSKLREDIIKRRISTCPSTASTAGVVDNATLIQKEEVYRVDHHRLITVLLEVVVQVQRQLGTTALRRPVCIPNHPLDK